MAAAPEIAFASKTLEDLSLPHQVDVDARTGAASISVGVPLSPGRSGFQPTLALAYSSAAGNSVYGLGWGLSAVPSIGLSTRKGLPRFDATDTYAFGGVELVPWLEGDTLARVLDGGEHWIHLYRGRVNGAFTRFEKWVYKRSRRVHWRVRDRNGSLSIFGLDEAGRSRIADPDDEHRTFEWLLEWQYDRHGNAIHYEYAAEDGAGVAPGESFELGRLRRGAFAQRYLRRIAYGNTAPLRPGGPDPAAEGWLFSVILDYGEREGSSYPPYSTDNVWPARRDPFSTYRAGFEVRTYRLCRRILMFHHFPEELGEAATLVGALTLEHGDDPAGSTLQSVHYTGFRREPQSGERSHRTLPPLVFQYTRPQVERAFVAAPSEAHENVPYGIGGLTYRMIDLHGEGLPGILFESDRAWYYKPNLGEGRFGPQRKVLERPSLQPGSYAFSDFDGDGNLNLVVVQGREAGHYELDRDEGRWTSFQAFAAAPHVRAFDTHTQLLDLSGDGRADIVTIEQDRITWYRSKGKEGFEAPVELARPRSNGVSRAPTIGANPVLDYFFADMTGDGLRDQVRVQNGRVEYWPQLGNGRFGAGVVMEGAPVLDFDGAFDASRIRLIDLDGSGTSDLLYIGRGEIRYWINASGNRFVEGGTITGLPYIDRLDSAAVLDFLGDGTLCLVWSSALPGRAGGPMQYLRLTGGVKPRLLETVGNSMGRETRITYGHSSRHYLRDLRGGRGWLSKLPQHSTVVDRLEVVDRIGNTRVESLFEYHDGFFDGGERTFRGFGLVDRYDSDTYRGTSTVAETDYADPVCVRTWFHNGAVGWERRRAWDHYAGDAAGATLPGPVIEDLGRFGPDDLAEAYRALAGQVVRTEVYGLDRDGERAAHPYQVTQVNHRVRRLQPKRGEHDPCFAVFASESLTYAYEQDPADPRVTHTFALAVDGFGNVIRSCAVAYPRRASRRIGIVAQERLHMTVSAAEFFNADGPNRYELGIPLESRTYELAGLAPPSTPGADSVFRLDELAEHLDLALAPERVLPFDQPFTSGAQARLAQWEQVYYWDDARTDVLPHGRVGEPPLVHHTAAVCFTDALLKEVFAERLTPDTLREEGRYRSHDGHWWQASATMHYLPADGFDLLAREVRTVRRDGAEVDAVTTYTYDEPHLLMLRRVTDALGNRIEAAGIDYHVLAPDRILDPNNNTSEVRYDALGVVVVASEHGRLLSGAGNEELYGNEPLAAYVPRPAASFDEILADPARFLQQASTFLHYEPHGWTPEDPRPLRSLSLVREARVHDGEGGRESESPIGVQITYADGFGRPLQVKERVEPGRVDYARDEDGHMIVNPTPPAHAEERWRVSGHTVFDNKQQVVRQYEPFFSPTHEFESDEELQAFGETTVTSYDPLGRATAILYPNLTTERTEFLAWETRRHDPNDTVVGSGYESVRLEYPPDHPEVEALRAARAHAGTPTHVHLDPLGRDVVVVEQGGDDGVRRTATALDFAGNPETITDPRDLVAFTYRRDMLGRVLYERSIDAGEKWALADALDRPLHLWDGRGVHQRIEHDPLGRPTAVHVVASTPALELDNVTERMFYGDDPEVAQAALRNLRGRVVRHYDQAGIFRIHSYDPAGNPLHSDRRLLADYKREPDWRDPGEVELENEAPFESRFRYDALGRVTRQDLPDGTTRYFDYQRGGGVARVRVTTGDDVLREIPFLARAVYNARGQRTEAALGDAEQGSAVVIEYEYNRQTQRLARLVSEQRIGDRRGRTYQDLHYTYDPVGNLVHSVDLAQQPPDGSFYAGIPTGVDSVSRFTYDAFYQLREASGRVHLAIEAHDYSPSREGFGPIKGTRHVTLNNMEAVRRYRRRYEYDASGNLQRMQHTMNGLGGPAGEENRRWHRDYWISATSNRSLPASDFRDLPIPDPESRFDAAGNCLYLPHLRGFSWNYRNNLASAVLIDRSGEDPPGDPEADTRPDDAEYYVYGGDGMRVRKVRERVVHGNGLEIVEKIYLDGCEIKRIRNGGGRPILERRTSHITDGGERLALLHQWTMDGRGRETDDISQKRIHFQLANHLGSASLEINERGDVISYEEYFPFGGTAFIASDDVVDVQLKDYRYSGKERDDATGLYCYGYRYYAPWVGRWLSPDPIGPADGFNLYGFVQNNPVNLVDSDGLRLHPVEEGVEIEGGLAGMPGQDRSFHITVRMGGQSVFHAEGTFGGSVRELIQALPEVIRIADEGEQERIIPLRAFAVDLFSDSADASSPVPRRHTNSQQPEPESTVEGADVEAADTANGESSSHSGFPAEWNLGETPGEDPHMAPHPPEMLKVAIVGSGGTRRASLPQSNDPETARIQSALWLESERHHAEEHGRRIGFGRVLADTVTLGLASEAAELWQQGRYQAHTEDYSGLGLTMAEGAFRLTPLGRLYSYGESAVGMLSSPAETLEAGAQAVTDFWNWVSPFGRTPSGSLDVRRLSQPDPSSQTAEERVQAHTARGMRQGAVLGTGMVAVGGVVIGFPGATKDPFPSTATRLLPGRSDRGGGSSGGGGGGGGRGSGRGGRRGGNDYADWVERTRRRESVPEIEAPTSGGFTVRTTRSERRRARSEEKARRSAERTRQELERELDARIERWQAEALERQGAALDREIARTVRKLHPVEGTIAQAEAATGGRLSSLVERIETWVAGPSPPEVRDLVLFTLDTLDDELKRWQRRRGGN